MNRPLAAIIVVDIMMVAVLAGLLLYPPVTHQRGLCFSVSGPANGHLALTIQVVDTQPVIFAWSNVTGFLGSQPIGPYNPTVLFITNETVSILPSNCSGQVLVWQFSNPALQNIDYNKATWVLCVGKITFSNPCTVVNH
jgi:hypothetical protein